MTGFSVALMEDRALHSHEVGQRMKCLRRVPIIHDEVGTDILADGKAIIGHSAASASGCRYSRHHQCPAPGTARSALPRAIVLPPPLPPFRPAHRDRLRPSRSEFRMAGPAISG